jgi:hypothetical protein
MRRLTPDLLLRVKARYLPGSDDGSRRVGLQEHGIKVGTNGGGDQWGCKTAKQRDAGLHFPSTWNPGPQAKVPAERNQGR